MTALGLSQRENITSGSDYTLIRWATGKKKSKTYIIHSLNTFETHVEQRRQECALGQRTQEWLGDTHSFGATISRVSLFSFKSVCMLCYDHKRLSTQVEKNIENTVQCIVDLCVVWGSNSLVCLSMNRKTSGQETVFGGLALLELYSFPLQTVHIWCSLPLTFNSEQQNVRAFSGCRVQGGKEWSEVWKKKRASARLWMSESISERPSLLFSLVNQTKSHCVLYNGLVV